MIPSSRTEFGLYKVSLPSTFYTTTGDGPLSFKVAVQCAVGFRAMMTTTVTGKQPTMLMGNHKVGRIFFVCSAL
jgi:hypothetical protein